MEEYCPTCRTKYDNSKKERRKLTDACGHHLCFSCMLHTEGCIQCGPEPKTPTVLNPHPSDDRSGTPTIQNSTQSSRDSSTGKAQHIRQRSEPLDTHFHDSTDSSIDTSAVVMRRKADRYPQGQHFQYNGGHRGSEIYTALPAEQRSGGERSGQHRSSTIEERSANTMSCHESLYSNGRGDQSIYAQPSSMSQPGVYHSRQRSNDSTGPRALTGFTDQQRLSPDGREESGLPPPPPDVAEGHLLERLGLVLPYKSYQESSSIAGSSGISSFATGDHLSDIGSLSPVAYHVTSSHEGRSHRLTRNQFSSKSLSAKSGESGDSCMSLMTNNSSADSSPANTLYTDPHYKNRLSMPHANSEEKLALHRRQKSNDSRTSYRSNQFEKSFQRYYSGGSVSSLNSLRRSWRGSARSLHNMNSRPSRYALSVNASSDDIRQLTIHPMTFEVPHQEESPIFIGRDWLFHQMEQLLCQPYELSRGVAIVGKTGSGKTSILEQLVELSSFGDGHGGIIQNSDLLASLSRALRSTRLDYAPFSNHSSYSSSPMDTLRSGSSAASSSSLGGDNYSSQSSAPVNNYSSLKRLASQVVAYHYCDQSNIITCQVAPFVCSIAAQMSRAPFLSSYKEYLLSEPALQNLLQVKDCMQHPQEVYQKAIIEPLTLLRHRGKIDNLDVLVVVDSLNDAEYHRPDSGTSIAGFLSSCLSITPSWIKFVVSVKTDYTDLIASLPLSHITLDENQQDEQANSLMQSDMHEYINYRAHISNELKANICMGGTASDPSMQHKFFKHLVKLSKGNLLYVKLTLNLIENGCLVLKTANFKILPINLHEVLLLNFNLKFSSLKSYERVRPLLDVCLASLSPLTLTDIYQSVNSAYTTNFLSWEEFVQRFETISSFLLERRDGRFAFFHPAFRDWLTRRENGLSPKFLADARHGSSLLALRLVRTESQLGAEQILELGHHILKAHLFKSLSKDIQTADVQAYWTCLSTNNPTAALTSPHNLFTPNVNVTQLLLLAGAQADIKTPYYQRAPLLSVCSNHGQDEMISILIRYGADVNGAGDDGMTPLHHAATRGHLNVSKTLIDNGAEVARTDNSGYTALTHAAINNHVEMLKYLFNCKWESPHLMKNNNGEVKREINHIETPSKPSFSSILQTAFVCSASKGHLEVTELLIEKIQASASCGMDAHDLITGETALTAACLTGQKQLVTFLLERGAMLTRMNTHSLNPLLCAVRAGFWDIAVILLHRGVDIMSTDDHGRSALLIAAEEGHVGLVEMLLTNGAALDQADHTGLTALSWASLKGKQRVVQLLIDRGAKIDQEDQSGRTPLALAAHYGDTGVVQYLLSHGAQIEHVDVNGMRPIDRAIGCHNAAVVSAFLRKGAKLTTTTWNMATGKPEISLLLLNKLLEDGNTLYKKSKLKDAGMRYSYALKKFPKENYAQENRSFVSLHYNLLISLSRCKRKLGELDSSIELASVASELVPDCYEAYFVKARAEREANDLQSSLSDLQQANKLAPNNPDVRKLLYIVKDEHSQIYRTDNLPPDEGMQLTPNDEMKTLTPMRKAPAETDL